MHVVLVTASAARHDYVHTEDGQVGQSLPALGRLAGDATVFSRAFASSPDPESTLRAILTGSHPTRERSPDSTLVDDVTDAGREVGLFHGDPDGVLASRGFEVPDAPADESAADRFRRRLGRTMAGGSAVGSSLERMDKLLGTTVGMRVGESTVRSGDAVTDRALSWLDETTGSRFLWVHYDDAAAPHVPREGTVSEGIDPRTATKLAYATENAPGALTEEERETLETLYRGELEHLDRCVGRLFDGVQTRLDPSETVTAFAGTSGCPMGERDVWYDTRGDFHDESVRVPLFFHGPEFDAETVEFAASSVDVLPTLLAAAGVEHGPQRGGSDLQTFLGRRVTERQVFGAGADASAQAMVCNSRWKLVRTPHAGRESLYDHGDDPAERRDRSNENLPVHRALSHALDCFVENRRNRRTESARPVQTAAAQRR